MEMQVAKHSHVVVSIPSISVWTVAIVFFLYQYVQAKFLVSHQV